MRITILVDNNTLIDRYLLGEPGFSAYLEDDNIKVLFDVGYSGIFLENANKLRIDLSKTDYLAVSHGHLDHTWGLDGLIRFYSEMDFEGIAHTNPVILAHPRTFTSISDEKCGEIGSLLSEGKLEKHFRLKLDAAPQWLSDDCVFLGAIPRKNNFEGRSEFGHKENDTDGDPVEDDSALVYKGTGGLVVLTGCSHSGICNIIEYAKNICGDDRIRDVIGGFHLLNPPEHQMSATKEYFRNLDIGKAHPCHCTDLNSKFELSKVIKVEETGVGLRLRYD